MKKIFLYCFLILFLFQIGSAVTLNQIEEIKLLSVSELENGSYAGHLATMYLQIRDGSGSVFIESYPLSKIDTQLSTRLANDISCSLTNKDCSKYDFFYTLRADSSLVGGPSAGAAITLLTMSMLEEKEVNAKIAMTGMISSGGVVLPVDGIKEKINAAQDAGLEKVYIPEIALGEYHNQTQMNELNITPLLEEDLNQFSINVIPITNIKETLNIEDESIFDIPSFYLDQMSKTRNELCKRTSKLLEDLKNRSDEESYKEAKNKYEKSQNLSQKANYYSSASFCYSGNIILRELQLRNMSQEILLKNYFNVKKLSDKFNKDIDEYKLKTYTDLETYMIVKERLIESADYLKDLNLTNISSSTLSYAIERYSSAVAWSAFLGNEGQPLQINKPNLQNACHTELRKVEMIKSYLSLLLPKQYLKDIDSSIDHANNFSEKENYKLCLYTATKAKANAEYLMTSLGIFDESRTKKIIQAKTNVIKSTIVKQTNAFPIMGYSYLEYSKNLLEEDPVSALLFAEYGLAFSDLSFYFPPQKSKINFNTKIDYKYLSVFFTGIIIGILLSRVFFGRKKRSLRRPIKAFSGKKR